MSLQENKLKICLHFLFLFNLYINNINGNQAEIKALQFIYYS